MITVREVVAFLEEIAPLELAEKWDNVGLLIGDFDLPVKRILFTLDVNNEVVEEAIHKGADLIIAHHPLIFHAQKTLIRQNYNQKMYMDLIKHDISVYAAHTNLDNAPNGMNQWLAEALELEHIDVMEEIGETKEGIVYGTGRIGKLRQPMCLEQFVEYVHSRVENAGIRYTGDKQKVIETVAVCGGAAQEYYPAAVKKQADVYVTGDVKYHYAQEMLDHQLACVDPGHYIEAICKEKLCELYQQWIKTNRIHVECIVSEVNTDPFIFRK
ncbi:MULTISPECIES: Nif3-like dinuclear metal center hexameric protein [unclassified Granulicatella]|uniref:Nif3-like dinuclear metal center hexameric protein n=1 Tax=unclassified Granulicatella TaxID=2630493 RepID=UPI001073AB50|nr:MULTISPECIES: Nif3-like dinuclear metal center hexameric protein [unclassified Granulicatella]MBF0780441.1 Nif3-like dinuclear metal center hexameric protein [Granulicatella sp. 19428wC4_WM01]TFU95430.1 Nif3-like dinuclear metal center hexameric protein [Granulicatella sp. WM01]